MRNGFFFGERASSRTGLLMPYLLQERFRAHAINPLKMRRQMALVAEPYLDRHFGN